MNADIIVKVFFIASCMIAIIFCLWFFVLRKLGQRTIHSSTRAVNNVPIRDTAAFVPVENISDGIVKLSGQERYVASVNCRGFDFFTMSLEEQCNVQDQFMPFVTTLTGRTTLRIDSVGNDLREPLYRYKNVREDFKKKYVEKQEEFEAISHKLNLLEAEDKEGPILYEKLVEIDKSLSCIERQLEYTEHIVAYLDALAGKKTSPMQENRYIFDWEYNPNFYQNAKLSKEEIRQKAAEELNQKATVISSFLSGARVHAKRDDDNALYDLSYRHYHPFYADLYKAADDNDSNSISRVVSGDRAFAEAKRKCAEERASLARLASEMEAEPQWVDTSSEEDAMSDEEMMVAKYSAGEDESIRYE